MWALRRYPPHLQCLVTLPSVSCAPYPFFSLLLTLRPSTRLFHFTLTRWVAERVTTADVCEFGVVSPASPDVLIWASCHVSVPLYPVLRSSCRSRPPTVSNTHMPASLLRHPQNPRRHKRITWWRSDHAPCHPVVRPSLTWTIERVSAAADRPARRRRSAHSKYSVSHHMVIKPFLLLGRAAKYRSRWWVWSTVARRPSEVYDTYRRTKLTAPETISGSRDTVGAHQNLNGSRNLTTPLLETVCHPWASICYRQPSLYLQSLQRYETRYKMSKWGGLG